MSVLTVGWSRAENAADMPQDSAVVFPDKPLTIGWRPMLNSAVLDWDPADLLVPPGAGPDKAQGPPPGKPPARPNQAARAPGAMAAEPSKSDPPGAPDVRVTPRRTMALFRRQGLVVDITTPVDATVSAVLMASVTQQRRGKLLGPRRRKVSRTKQADTLAGRRTRLVLPISNDGRRAIDDYESLKATLHVVARYDTGRKLAVERPVLLARTPLKSAKRTRR